MSDNLQTLTGYARGKKHPRYTLGMSGTPICKKWNGMKRRCLNKNDKAYARYGGRGIKISDEWMLFENFYRDMNPTFKEGLSLERIDNNGDYCKENCKWIPLSEQGKNKRNVEKYTLEGKTLTISEWSKLKGIGRYTLYARIKVYKMDIEKALSKPNLRK